MSLNLFLFKSMGSDGGIILACGKRKLSVLKHFNTQRIRAAKRPQVVRQGLLVNS